MNDTCLEKKILKHLSDGDSFKIWDGRRCHLDGFYTFEQLIKIGEILKADRLNK